MAAEQRDYDKRDNLVAGLRELADLYEKNGVDKLPLPDYKITVNINVTQRKPDTSEGAASWATVVDDEATKKAVKKAMRGLGRGRKEKSFDDYSFSVSKHFGELIKVKIETSRDAVCRKVATGNKIVTEAHTYTTPRSVEDEYEWVCDDPVLSAPEEDAA